MTPATTHSTNAMAEKIVLKSNGRTQTKGSRTTKVIMKSVPKILIALSPRTRRVIRHGIHPWACFPSVDSGRVILLYIRSNNSKRNNNISGTKLKCLVFGAETAQWTDLACTHSIWQVSNIHLSSSSCTSLTRITGRNHLRRSTPPAIWPRLTKYIRPVTKSPTISWTTPPQHTITDTLTLLWLSILALAHLFRPLHSRAFPFAPHLMGRANGVNPVIPPYSPVPPMGSPYPYPFRHIHCGQSYGGSYHGTIDLSQMDSNIVREQLVLQMRIYALSHGGMVSDSALSPSSTPFPRLQYNPWAFLQTSNAFGVRRGGLAESMASRWLSLSHQPVALPPLSRGNRGLRHRERSQDLRQREKLRPPPCVESTHLRNLSHGNCQRISDGGWASVRNATEARSACQDESVDDEDEADLDDGCRLMRRTTTASLLCVPTV